MTASDALTGRVGRGASCAEAGSMAAVRHSPAIRLRKFTPKAGDSVVIGLFGFRRLILFETLRKQHDGGESSEREGYAEQAADG